MDTDCIRDRLGYTATNKNTGGHLMPVAYSFPGPSGHVVRSAETCVSQGVIHAIVPLPGAGGAPSTHASFQVGDSVRLSFDYRPRETRHAYLDGRPGVVMQRLEYTEETLFTVRLDEDTRSPRLQHEYLVQGWSIRQGRSGRVAKAARTHRQRSGRVRQRSGRVTQGHDYAILGTRGAV